ncbi:MAG: Xaa-Pro peptidase family protein [Verrucomicrobiota bacterium]|nr:Xaa-Pro peptidase family protein [Verrucomicrobiota bacterium]
MKKIDQEGTAFATLLYSDTHKSADALYFGQVQVPDPFIAFQAGKKKVAVVSALEFARVSKVSKFDVVLPLEDYTAKAKARYNVDRPKTAQIAQLLAEEFGIAGFRIPQDFPAGLALELIKNGVKVEVAEGSLFDHRNYKTDAEVAEIKRANNVASAAFKEVERILTSATIKPGGLMYNNKLLTSEVLQRAIGVVCINNDASPNDPIVAGGDQACDPHCRGSGAIKAGELIIVDIFPRMLESGYHGDMTRTYLKGAASDAQKKLVKTVQNGQKLALKAIKAGINGRSVYDIVKGHFDTNGYQTQKVNGVNVGFFHGLGHGLGLDVHEPPRVAPVDVELKVGHVVTVEPGLYYPGLGGCRIEDVVRVTADGMEMLSKHAYRWQID